MNYENVGYKRTGTSEDAAKAMQGSAKTLRIACFRALMFGNFTADEIAKKLGIGILAIRPRLSELYKQGFVEDSGERRPNRSGKMAIVWQAK